MIARFRSRADDDRGVVMIIFVGFIVAALGLAALVTDLGEGRDARRRLVTATDAAALAAAQDYSHGRNGCNADEDDSGTVDPGERSTAEELLQENAPNAQLDVCGAVASTFPGAWVVTVAAHENVGFLFGGVTGNEGATAYSTTSVRYGRPNAVTGLRPFGLCRNLPAVAQWAAAGYPSPSQLYTINFQSNNNYCGAQNSNWALLDMDGWNGTNCTYSGGSSEIRNWSQNGYPHHVNFGDTVCGEHGSIASGSGFNDIIPQGVVTFPMMDNMIDDGGNKSRWTVVGFAAADVEVVVDNGANAARHMKLRFYQFTPQYGQCCSTGGYFGTTVYDICGIDNSDTNANTIPDDCE